MIGGGLPLLSEILDQTDRIEAKFAYRLSIGTKYAVIAFTLRLFTEFDSFSGRLYHSG